MKEKPAQPEQRTCLVTNKPCKHGSWCSEVYCQEHCKFARPEQEPVAWATQMGEYAHIHWGAKRPEYPMVYEIPLYTTPPQRKPLTDEEIAKEVEAELTHYWNGEYIDTSGARDQLTAFARAIEAAHGIKE